MDMITSASPRAWTAVGVGVFIAALFFKIIFGDLDGFIEGVRYWLRHYYFTMTVREDVTEVKWSGLKLVIWILLSVGCGILAYYQLPGWLPGLFG